MTTTICASIPAYPSEVQFPKELRPAPTPTCPSMPWSLNEVQFPKELRLGDAHDGPFHRPASMKCSSRRNCDWPAGTDGATRSSLNEVQFPKELRRPRYPRCRRQTQSLNEVQFPKELRHFPELSSTNPPVASMKCSSRRNCDGRTPPCARSCPSRLNEVQFPKELRLVSQPHRADSAGPQ